MDKYELIDETDSFEIEDWKEKEEKNMNNFNEALKNNRTRYQENLRKEILRAKREQKKETVITVLVGAFIVIATIMLLNGMSDCNDKALTKCINEGHSTNYCVRTVQGETMAKLSLLQDETTNLSKYINSI